MSYWEEQNLEEKVTNILAQDPYHVQDHHLGRPFLTAYQIAIEFNRRHPDDVDRLDLPVGGSGVGRRNSLAQYLAHQISAGIKAGRIMHIEGGFLSNQHLNCITFDNDGVNICSSLTNTQFTLSMFRLCD